MKYVLIPEAVKLVEPKSGKRIKQMDENNNVVEIPPITMAAFIRDNVLNDQRIGKGGEGIRRIIRVEKALEPRNSNVRNGQLYAVFDTEDHKKLMEIVNDLTWQAPLIGRQYYPFIEALEQATDELPAPVVESEPEKPNGATAQASA